MAYSEIIGEIQEQMDDITAKITSNNVAIEEKQAELADLQNRVPELQQAMQGLETLKSNAEQLIASLNDVNVNLNVQVNATPSSTLTITSASGKDS